MPNSVIASAPTAQRRSIRDEKCSQREKEKDKARQRGVVGMFDVSARPFVPQGRLTFAVPINKFKRMVDDTEESFLITQSWARVFKRIEASHTKIKHRPSA